MAVSGKSDCAVTGDADMALLSSRWPHMSACDMKTQSESSIRISFSGNLGRSDIVPVEHRPRRRDTTLLDSNSDFEFNICRNFEQESFPADEIFANGMILPFQVQDRMLPPKRLYKYELPPLISIPPPPSSPPPPPMQVYQPNLTENSRKETLKENPVANSDSEAEKTSKSFWSFTRSSSLNCEIKRGLLCPFPRLARSNSAGSVTNSKRVMLKDTNKHSSQKHDLQGARTNHSSFSSVSSSLCCNVYHLKPHKCSDKKNDHGAGSFHGNGSSRISPILTVPSSFKLGSILRGSKEKKNNKK